MANDRAGDGRDQGRHPDGPFYTKDSKPGGARRGGDDKPRIICPTTFQGRTPPLRRWTAHNWIPCRVVTGLYGDGGVGKSLLAQQLQTGTALGSAWLGLPVEEIGSLGVYCEDDEEELWRRQRDINVDYCTDFDALGAMHWMPRLGEENLLMTFTRNGVGEITKFHRHVLEAALDLEAKLVIIDTAADTFGGSENDRNHVRQYVQRALGQIALKIDGSVVCCAHPSRAGLNSGEGDGGSTGWSNAFRSRLYLRHEEGDDPNVRVLERRKANYAAKNDVLRLHWRNGVIIADEALSSVGVTSMGRADAKAAFLDLVREMEAQSRPVSSNKRSGNYAPRLFEELREQNHGLKKYDFEKAMNALLKARKIMNVPYGRKGDERTKLAVSGENESPEETQNAGVEIPENAVAAENRNEDTAF